jgi:hypothetical protein
LKLGQAIYQLPDVLERLKALVEVVELEFLMRMMLYLSEIKNSDDLSLLNIAIVKIADPSNPVTFLVPATSNDTAPAIPDINKAAPPLSWT